MSDSPSDVVEVSKKVEEALAKLRHGVQHIRNMQEQVRNMFQFCCILGFGYSLYRLSAESSGVSDIYNMVVSLVISITVQKGIMVTNNWTKIFLGLVSTSHLLLFLACIPIEYSSDSPSDFISTLLEFRSITIRLDDAVCSDCGQQLPVSAVLFFMIFLCDRYMENTYRTTSASYNAMIRLAQRLEKENDSSSKIAASGGAEQRKNGKKKK